MVKSPDSFQSNTPQGAESQWLRKLIRQWLQSSAADGLSDATMEDYRDKVFKFQWWLATNYPTLKTPRDITPDMMVDFVAYLRGANAQRWGTPSKVRLSPVSVQSYANTVKVFFGYLVRKGVIATTPFTDEVRIRAVHKRDKVIKTVGQDELTRLLTYVADPIRTATFEGLRNATIITLLLDSGIRLGELLSMRMVDLDFRLNQVKVDGKEGRRIAPFSATCKAQLLKYYKVVQHHGDSSHLWLNRDATPMTITGLQSAIRRIRLGCGVDFSAHRLRHTYATMLAGQGIDAFTLMRLLGHNSLDTSLKYINLNYEGMAAEYQVKSPLTRLAADATLPASVARRRGRPVSQRLVTK